MSHPQSPLAVSQVAARIYEGVSPGVRALQRVRPFACPFDAFLADVPPGSRVLDVGCGSGLFLGLLGATGRISSGVGFDSSVETIAAAEAMSRNLGDNGRSSSVKLEFLVHDADRPWPEGDFDVVSMIDVMHHLPPAIHRNAFQSLAARVRPGGTVIYKDMVRRPRWRAWMNRLHDLILARQWIHYRPIDDVDRWAAEEGLVIRRADTINRWWYGHELRVFQRPYRDSMN